MMSIRPKKRLGQHFLSDPHHLNRIADAADLIPEDVILEIGPGTGTLTEVLLSRAGLVVAVEIDRDLIAHLRQRLNAPPTLKLVHGDILDVDPTQLITEHAGRPVPYKVVANLPYYITSPILRHLLEASPPPTLIVVTVQEEVARRICATPPHMSILAVSVQFYGEPRIVHRIPRGAFYPPPEVDSAVVRIDVFPSPRVNVPDRSLFFRVVRAGFGQRRKQLRNALAAGLRLSREDITRALTQAGIAPRRRAETLTLDEWARLTWAVAEVMKGDTP